jgi:hypothetical protein
MDDAHFVGLKLERVPIIEPRLKCRRPLASGSRLKPALVRKATMRSQAVASEIGALKERTIFIVNYYTSFAGDKLFL